MICPVVIAAVQLLVPVNVPLMEVPAAFIVAVPFALAEQFGKFAAAPAPIVIVNVNEFPDAVPAIVGICAEVAMPGNDIVPVTCVPFSVRFHVMVVDPVTVPVPIIVPSDATPVPTHVPVKDDDPPDGAVGDVGFT